MELSNLNHPYLFWKFTTLQMFRVSVPRIFKNAGRAFVIESFFSIKKFIHFYSSVENSFTCIGIFWEVTLLLSQSTGCHATKKQAPNYLSRNSLWKLPKILQNSQENTCARVSLLVKLQIELKKLNQFAIEFCEISSNSFFHRTRLVATSE